MRDGSSLRSDRQKNPPVDLEFSSVFVSNAAEDFQALQLVPSGNARLNETELVLRFLQSMQSTLHQLLPPLFPPKGGYDVTCFERGVQHDQLILRYFRAQIATSTGRPLNAPLNAHNGAGVTSVLEVQGGEVAQSDAGRLHPRIRLCFRQEVVPYPVSHVLVVHLALGAMIELGIPTSGTAIPITLVGGDDLRGGDLLLLLFGHRGEFPLLHKTHTQLTLVVLLAWHMARGSLHMEFSHILLILMLMLMLMLMTTLHLIQRDFVEVNGLKGIPGAALGSQPIFPLLAAHRSEVDDSGTHPERAQERRALGGANPLLRPCNLPVEVLGTRDVEPLGPCHFQPPLQCGDVGHKPRTTEHDLPHVCVILTRQQVRAHHLDVAPAAAPPQILRQLALEVLDVA